MDAVKEAFQKVKSEMSELKSELSKVISELEQIKLYLHSQKNIQNQQTHPQTIQTFPRETQTHNLNEPLNLPLEASKNPNLAISTGNRGVPTDRQTDQQTDRHINPTQNQTEIGSEAPIFPHPKSKPSKLDHIDEVSQVLSSLDSIMKDLRHKVKNLTKQEMLIFLTIYQLQEESLEPDYSSISRKLGLSESSIRDYVLKITKKGIPITKTKQNNKKILLSISEDFKKIAPINTLIRLRDI